MFQLKPLHHSYLLLPILGFADTGDAWRSAYETPNLSEQLDKLYSTLKPFYQQLHAYIRRKLNNIYSNYGTIKADGPIPAHLLGIKIINYTSFQGCN